MCYTTPPPTVSQAGGVFKNHKAKIREEIVSQNLLGLKSEARLEEFFFSFRNRGLLAACVQETWRPGKDTLENGDCLLFLSGLKSMKSNRGEQGVGIALSQGVWQRGKRRDLSFTMILVAESLPSDYSFEMIVESWSVSSLSQLTALLEVLILKNGRNSLLNWTLVWLGKSVEMFFSLVLILILASVLCKEETTNQ